MALVFVAAAALPAYADDAPKLDPWQPVRFLVGDWKGTASGEPGTGTVERSYELILNGRFVEERNTSTYPPQGKNEMGEVHHHRAFISYDRARKTLMLRQFHEEGFVNLYAMSSAASGPGKLVFESVHFENFDNAWKARETYDVVSHDELIETFELAPPGKPFEIYSKSHLERSK